jgi:hypothetical protein
MVRLPWIFPPQVLESRAFRTRDPFVKFEWQDLELFLSRVVVCKLIIAPSALKVQKPDRAMAIIGREYAERRGISRTGLILVRGGYRGARSVSCRRGAGNGRHLVPVRGLDWIPDMPLVGVVVHETSRAEDVIAVVVVVDSRSGINCMTSLRTI